MKIGRSSIPAGTFTRRSACPAGQVARPTAEMTTGFGTTESYHFSSYEYAGTYTIEHEVTSIGGTRYTLAGIRTRRDGEQDVIAATIVAIDGVRLDPLKRYAVQVVNERGATHIKPAQ